MNILKKIVENKKLEINFDKQKYSFGTLEKLIQNYSNRGFKKLLKNSNQSKKNNIIGEIKKASPSAGEIIHDYDPIKIAKKYNESGIKALSILTDKKFFQGDIEHITLVNNKIKLPILRKDFIIDPYQVIQSKFYKADAILIIMSILSFSQAKEIIDIANKYNIDCLIEIHNYNEIDNALKLDSPLIGINNRNLDTLKVDKQNSLNLSKEIPNKFTIVAESGINSKKDINIYNEAGIYNFLIGESILKSNNSKKLISDLI